MADINGTDANDRLDGTTGDDVIFGGAGDDVIVAGAGNDIINGQDGRDNISGQDGADIIYGGPGNDNIDGGFGADQIFGEDGNDSIRGSLGNDQLFGGNGDDSVWGDTGNDVISGGDGNDILEGFGDHDTINGDAGMDRVMGGNGNDILNGGADNDLVLGGAGDDTIIHTVGEGSDSIDGGTGIDTLVIGLSTASMTDAVRADLATLKNWFDSQAAAANGDLTVLATEAEGSSLYLANLGLDLALFEQASFVLDGRQVSYEELMNVAPVAEATAALSTSEDTQITGQVIATDTAGDTLTWSVEASPTNGTLALDASTGAYIYTPSANFSGTDTFSIIVADQFGASVTQTISLDVAALADAPSLSVRDSILDVSASRTSAQHSVALDVSAALADVDGSEKLAVRIAGVPAGAVLSAGQLGADGVWELTAADLTGLSVSVTSTADFQLSVSAIATEANGSTATAEGTIAVTFEGDEPLVTGTTGTDGNDTLTGTDADETIAAGAGDDTASGGAGNDLFIAASGNDIYDGGEGFDTLDMSAAAEASVNLRNGNVRGLGNDTVTGFENVIGSAGNDRIVGSDQANVIDGGAGNDRIWAHEGDDMIDGGAGNDAIRAGRGNDIIRDGAGDDEARGGEGNDTIIAGAGNDRYFGGSGFDTLDFSEAEAGVVIDTRRGVAEIGDGEDQFQNFEAYFGSDYADAIKGSNRGEVFMAGAGDDIIRGGRGGDVMTGGDGADTFVWARGDASGSRGRDLDTITDFEEGDRLDLSALAELPRRFNGEAIDIRDGGDGAIVSVQIGRQMVDVVVLDGVTADQASAWQDAGYIFA